MNQSKAGAVGLAMVALLQPLLLAGESGTRRPAAGDQVFELPSYEVVSTATRASRLAIEVPLRTEVLSKATLEATGAGDLCSALDYLPGARSESNCQNCGTTEIKLLGLGTGYSQLLLDGHPVFSGLASVYGLEHIPTAFIERIEVVKGGGSALYGPGAVAGVINVVPEQPQARRVEGEVRAGSARGGASWSVQAVGDYLAKSGGLAASLYDQRSAAEAIDLNGDGFSELTERDFGATGMHAWIEPKPDARLSAHFGRTWEYRRGGDRFDLAPHEAQIAEQLEHHWLRGGARWENRISPEFAYELAATVSDVRRDSYYGGVGAVALPGEVGYDPKVYAQALDQSRKLYGYTESSRLFADALFRHQLGEHGLSWGLQYQRDELFDEKRDARGRPLRVDGELATAVGEDPIASGSFELLGAMIQDEWTPTSRWTVIGGARIDQHSALDDPVVSPRVALRHTSGQDWTLRASVASGFRAPEIFDEDLHVEILEDPTRIRNAADLREERSLSTAAGLVWKPSFAEDRLQADIEVFRTRISDTFFVSDAIQLDERGAYKIRRNSGGASVAGVEANVAWRATERLSGEIGASYVDARFDQVQEILPGLYESRFLEAPRLSGVAQIRYANERLFDFFLGVVYTGPLIAVEEVAQRLNRQTPEFWVVDASVSKHFELGEQGMHLDLSVGVRNLFDERQRDLGVGPERDTSYVYGPRSPRSFYVQARVHY